MAACPPSILAACSSAALGDANVLIPAVYFELTMPVNPESTRTPSPDYAGPVKKWTQDQRQAFGQRLAAARLRAGFTQPDVAAWFEKTKQTVSAWEKGTNLPTIEQVAVLSHQYGVAIEHLVFGTQVATPFQSSTLLALAQLDREQVAWIENSVRGAMRLQPIGNGDRALPEAASGKRLAAR